MVLRPLAEVASMRMRCSPFGQDYGTGVGHELQAFQGGFYMNTRLALLFATALSTTPAFAQTVEQEPNTVEDAGLGDIIVTAQRRSENLQDVPVAVSASRAKALPHQAFGMSLT